jgi:hypothetical protein
MNIPPPSELLELFLVKLHYFIKILLLYPISIPPPYKTTLLESKFISIKLIELLINIKRAPPSESVELF